MGRTRALGISSSATGASAVAVGTTVTNALGYILTMAGARLLLPEEFGAFSALLAMAIVGNVAALAIQASVARAHARGKPTSPLVRAAFGLTFIGTVALVAATGFLSSVLQLDSPVAVLACTAAIAATALTAPALGHAQGRERFASLATLLAMQAAFRAGGGIVGIVITDNAAGGFIGIAVGLTIAGAIAWLASHPSFAPDDHVSTRRMARTIIASTAMLLGFVILTNVDVMLARHILPAETSGLYGAGAIFTKIAFWLPQFVPMFAFPALADPARRRNAVKFGMLAVTACGALVVLLAWLLSDFAVTVVAGPKYMSVVPYIAGFTALGALYAVAHLLVYAHLAHGDRWTTAVLWLVLAGYVTYVELTATDLAGVLIPGIVTASIVVCWGLIREKLHRSRQTLS